MLPRSPAETVKTRKEITFDPINFLTMQFFQSARWVTAVLQGSPVRLHHVDALGTSPDWSHPISDLEKKCKNLMKYLFSEKIYGLFHVSISFDISPVIEFDRNETSLLIETTPPISDQSEFRKSS